MRGRTATLLTVGAGRLSLMLPFSRVAGGWLLFAQLGGLERGDDVRRLVRGDFDEREVIVDVDSADVLAVQPGLVGDGAHEILRSETIRAAHGDEEAGHPT